MSVIQRIKLLVLILFVAFAGGVYLFTDNSASRRAHAFSAGPPAGYTRAPGEEPESCAECHLVTETGTGRIEIDAPRTYVPGETYRITIRHVNADTTRRRWGFQLTALDESEQKAGALASLDNLTQVLNNQGPFPNRQYIEHTSAGTFDGQTGGASWTFDWTAPATDVGVVTFYAAGNHANGDQNTSGDHIYFTFVTSTPTAPAPDFSVTVSPSSRIATPGGSASYDVTVTPAHGFTGQVNLQIAGLPTGASASFNPSTINVDSASAQSSALTVNTTNATPLGSFQLTVNGTSGALQRTAQTTLVVASPSSADLSITKTDSPDPSSVRANLTYRITVANNGPANASGVSVADTLPASVNFVSATATQGACSGATNVVCAIGSLNAGASAVVTIVVQPQNAGQLTNSASVTANQTDPVSSNNSATTTTAVELQGSEPLMLAPNLSVRTIARGLEQPTGLAFLGANDFLVIEKASGKVKRIVNGALHSVALDLPVASGSEQGLLGIALHPGFAQNRYVYLFWTENGPGIDTTDLSVVTLLGNRVDRYVWNGSTLTFDRNIARLRAYQEDEGQPLRGNHNGGRLAFGPDGKLYVLIGDVGRRGFMQNVTTAFGPAGKDDAWGGPEPDDAHLTGVILRLNDDGTAPVDNPFFNASTGLSANATENVKKVFAYGIRNGFGLAFDPLGGRLWMQDNGDDSFDEINRIAPGFNGGWIQTMGPVSRVQEYKAIEVSRAGGLQQIRWPPTFIADTPADAQQKLYQLPGSVYTDPQFSWKYAVAPSPIGFASGDVLGSQYANDLFVGASRTTLLGGYLFRFKLTPDRLKLATTDARLADNVADNADKFDLTESESLVAGRDFGITTDIKTGPNGNLYVVSLSNGAVYEIFSRKELFVTNLNGAQEVPANNSPAKGTATITLDADGATARVSLVFNNLTSPQTDAHIHGPASPGANAGILFDLPDGSFSDFQITLTPEQAKNLRAGLLYINVHSQNHPGGEIRGQFGGPSQASSIPLLSSATTSVSEGAGSVSVNVSRMGDISASVEFGYETSNGTANERSDYTTARGTLRFASGETTKSVNILVTDDAHVEGDESFVLTIKSPPESASALNTSATITINDNDANPSAQNPIDDAEFFVRQHYNDFLNRAPDASGLAFWAGQINSCGANSSCRAEKRVDVSGAFFLSIEFQQTGYLVYRLNEASFDRQPRFHDFLRDTQEIARGVVVGQGNWEAQIEANRNAFANAWAARAEFRNAFDSLTNVQYVDRLFANAGVAPSTAARESLINGLNSGEETRASVLLKVADNEQFKQLEFARAFVQMQYFGYLRRNPDDAPDNNFDGYNFWLTKLNQFGGDFRRAEMVKSFIVSSEYRSRFGAP